MPDTSVLQATQPQLLQALQNLLGNGTGQSALLASLWDTFNGPIVIGAAGGGTYYGSEPVFGVAAIVIDQSMLPNAAPYNGENRSLTITQLATVIGHDLTHAVIPQSHANYALAANPAAAVAIGETNELIAIHVQWSHDRQPCRRWWRLNSGSVGIRSIHADLRADRCRNVHGKDACLPFGECSSPFRIRG